MSCDAALAFTLHLAMAFAPSANPLTHEPLFASIVRTAGVLETEADALRHTAPPAGGMVWRNFRTRAMTLSQLDMQGHLELARRGTDGDLKCILRGLSQDLPRKLDEVETADAAGRHTALDELYFLLRDNVETLTAPSRPPV